MFVDNYQDFVRLKGIVIFDGGGEVMKKLIWIFLSVSFVSFSLSAEEKKKPEVIKEAEPADGKSEIDLNEVKEEQNQTVGEDIDDLIQNNQLRAQAGSKSKFSVSASLNYDGGSISAPFAAERPNIAAETGSTNQTFLSGDISTQYNITPVHALSAGIGMRWISPFSKLEPGDYEGTQFDMQDPFIAYQYVYDYRGLESVLDIRVIHFTEGHLVERGYSNSLALSQDSFYKIPQTRWNVGFSSWAQVSNYTKEGPLGTPEDDFYMGDVREDQSDYGIGFEPLVEYEVNDKFTVRATTILWGFEHARIKSDPFTFRVNRVIQTLGMGISVIRDVYLFPSIQFPMNDIRKELVTVSLSAELNAF